MAKNGITRRAISSAISAIASSADAEALHEERVVAAALRLEQVERVGRGEGDQQPRHGVVARVLRAVDRAHHRHGGKQEEGELGDRGHPERLLAGREKADPRHQPEHAGDGERAALQRIDAGPVGAGGHQERDRDGGDEAPEHLVRVPGDALQRPDQDLRRPHPDRDRDQRPGGAEQVERPEGELEERVQARRPRRRRIGLLDRQDAAHGDSAARAGVVEASRRGRPSGMRSGSRWSW